MSTVIIAHALSDQLPPISSAVKPPRIAVSCSSVKGTLLRRSRLNLDEGWFRASSNGAARLNRSLHQAYDALKLSGDAEL